MRPTPGGGERNTCRGASMDSTTRALNALLRALRDFTGLLLTVIGFAESWLRLQLSILGVPPELHTPLLIGVEVLLALAALRLLGGVLRIVAVVLLILLALDLLSPALQI
jgi:hypothetical protein